MAWASAWWTRSFSVFGGDLGPQSLTFGDGGDLLLLDVDLGGGLLGGRRVPFGFGRRVDVGLLQIALACCRSASPSREPTVDLTLPTTRPNGPSAIFSAASASWSAIGILSWARGTALGGGAVFPTHLRRKPGRRTDCPKRSVQRLGARLGVPDPASPGRERVGGDHDRR